jgi:putative GTP pyrophosphokinase
MLKVKKPKTITEKLIGQYEQLRPTYQSFCTRLQELFKTLLIEANIIYHTVEFRTKKISSFREKINRPDKKYNSIKQLIDLCGVRIIVYYPEDVERVVNILYSEFIVDKDNSSNKVTQLQPHEFGYSSVHLVVSLLDPRRNLVEWRQMKDFKAEIQVRTVLQHAWAAISHALQYKHEEEVPRNLRRRLFRLSGLLELADEEFSFLNREHQALASKLAIASAEVMASVAIDRVSLSEWVRRSTLSKAFSENAAKAGFTIVDDSEVSAISNLAWICRHFAITTISELEGMVKSVESTGYDFLMTLFSRQHSMKRWVASPEFVVMLILIFVFHDRLTSTDLVSQGWDGDIATFVINVAKSYEKS